MLEPVVTLREIRDDVVQIRMQDKLHKNTFTEELIDGLVTAFEKIKDNTSYKVVILTGYDNYFASGGTQESLIHLYQGRGNFTDVNLYCLALDCPIPVIALMQGHGIGGGFIMGLFADFILLSRESIYTANFMKYGFTPGMGATLILPHKVGMNLAQEMLLTGRTYHGEDLKQRGVSFPILPRSELQEYALELAFNLAEKPRISLITLKAHLVSSLREQLSHKIQQELKMHEMTFHQEEVRENISTKFGR